VLVSQHHRQPVDLQLAHVSVRGLPQLANHPQLPGRQVFLCLGIVEGEQRPQMGDGCEEGRDRRPDPLGGRVRGDQLGMGGLQPLQLPDQGVVFGIRDQRVVEDVIPVGMGPDLAAQLFGPVGDL
jgi:hypothetical protein